jgi:PAS domain S-box-containing protein
MRLAEHHLLIATHTANAIIFTNSQRHIMWVNEEFTRFTGYTAKEALGRKPGEFLQFELTEPATIQAMHDAFDRGQRFQGGVYNRHKNGQTYWVNLDIIPLHQEVG